MAIIDIGAGATNRANTLNSATSTMYDLNNPANDTGVLDTFEVWFNTDATGVKLGTFFLVSESTYSNRDGETIGNVTSGSKQTFTGKSCDVVSGDLIGSYNTTGILEKVSSGGSGIRYKTGDQFGTGNQSTSLSDSDGILSLYATGATAAAGNPYYYYLQQ